MLTQTLELLQRMDEQIDQMGTWIDKEMGEMRILFDKEMGQMSSWLK